MESDNPTADIAFEDGLSATLAKYSQPQEEVAPEAPPQEQTEQAPKAEKAADPQSEEKAAEPELSSVILARLADKDAETRAAREELKRLQAELEALKAESTPKEPAPTKSFLQEAVELGLDQQLIQASLLAESLGDDAPPDIKAMAIQAKQELRLKRLEQPQEKPTDKANPTLTAQVAVMQSQLDSFVQDVPESFGMLHGASKSNPQLIQDLMEGVTARYYESHGKFPAVHVAAKIAQDSLEEQLEQLSSFKGTSTASIQSTPTESARQPEALSDAESAQLPDRGGEDPATEYDFQADVASAIAAMKARTRG